MKERINSSINLVGHLYQTIATSTIHSEGTKYFLMTNNQYLPAIDKKPYGIRFIQASKKE